jgi:hypothetical protein
MITGPARVNRPFTRLGIAGMAAHVFFELAAGVGMPLASVLGPGRGAALWSGASALGWRAARSRSSSLDCVFSLVNAFGLAAVIAHLAAWPSRRTRLGLPWLVTCEGLDGAAMRYYNPILYFSGAACAVALLRENRTARPPLLAAVLLPVLVPAIAASQHLEHRLLKLIAADRPAWWNRRLAKERGTMGTIVMMHLHGGALDGRTALAETADDGMPPDFVELEHEDEGVWYIEYRRDRQAEDGWHFTATGNEERADEE